MKAFLMPMLAAALLAPAEPLLAAPATPAPMAASPATEALSLAQAVHQAQRHNGELRILGLELAALEARAVQAGAMPNPTLELLREGRQQQGGTSALQLAIPLELGGKRAARSDTAQAELSVAAADLSAARLRVRAEVVAAFHEAYLAEQRVALADRSSALARRSTRSASLRVIGGKISPVEETRASVDEANVQLDAIVARRDLAEARSKLALLLGSDANALTALAAPELALPAAPDAGAIEAGLAQAPSLRRAAAELDWRRAAARLERARRYPDVSLIVGQKREGIGRERQTVVGLSVPLPVFDRNQGAIAEAERRVDKAGIERDLARQRLRADALQAGSRLQAALEQEGIIRAQVVPAAERNFNAATKGFEAGKFSVLEVLDAQRSHVQAQAQHLRTISEAHRAAADLASLIGPQAPPSFAVDQQEMP